MIIQLQIFIFHTFLCDHSTRGTRWSCYFWLFLIFWFFNIFWTEKAFLLLNFRRFSDFYCNFTILLRFFDHFTVFICFICFIYMFIWNYSICFFMHIYTLNIALYICILPRILAHIILNTLRHYHWKPGAVILSEIFEFQNLRIYNILTKNFFYIVFTFKK